MDDLFLILTALSRYNTAVVLAGASALGVGAGVVGAVVLLRRRSLMSDSISHSTLPGIGIGFLVAVALGGSGRELPFLMLGAMGSAILGVFAVQWIVDHTRLAEDAAIGTVLSVFYGVGIVLLSFIQSLDVGSKAGLNGFLLGSAASILAGEAWMICIASLIVAAVTVALLKEFRVLCFDPGFAAAGGWPVNTLDLVLMGLLLAIVSIGLKTVGMVLIIAIVIIPAVAARFWTNRMGTMLAISGCIGGLSALSGVVVSALAPDIPTGAMIVLVAGGLFLVSFVFAPKRGLFAVGARGAAFRMRVVEHLALKAAETGSDLSASSRVLLRLRGLIRSDGSLSPAGQAALEQAATRGWPVLDKVPTQRPAASAGFPERGRAG